MTLWPAHPPQLLRNNARVGERHSVIIVKKFVFILLALPVVIVVLLLLTKMRWKFSKPATKQVNAPEMVVTASTPTPAPSPSRIISDSPKLMRVVSVPA